jgi:ABC-type sugar transport system ATPase subunit
LSGASPALLELRGVSKYYPGVTALDGVEFSVRGGEIHALLGENGAGKSTLVKMVTGAHRPDRGTLAMRGHEIAFASPADSRRAGIAVVPQDINLVPGLSLGRNVLLGMESPFSGRRRLSREERTRVSAALAVVGLDADPETPARALEVAQQRLAQVASALLTEADIIVLDEPTAVLPEPDAEHVTARLAALRDQGRGIVYVTHRLSEVIRLADRITVLRDGRQIGRFERGEVREEDLVALLTKPAPEAQAALEPSAPARDAAPFRSARAAHDASPLEVEALGAFGRFEDVSFRARPGEIVGFAGVQGAGQNALLRAVAGLEAVDRGRITLAGKDLPLNHAHEAFERGIRYVPADRRRDGIFGMLSVSDNLALTPRVRQACRRLGLRWPAAEREMARSYVGGLAIRPARVEALARNLSGGNQQKVVIGRVLESGAAVVLVEEPTQGVDVAAKREIHAALRDLAAASQCAVVVASSDFEELLGLADILHVMRMGRLVATLPAGEASYAAILGQALK